MNDSLWLLFWSEPKEKRMPYKCACLFSLYFVLSILRTSLARGNIFYAITNGLESRKILCTLRESEFAFFFCCLIAFVFVSIIWMDYKQKAMLDPSPSRSLLLSNPNRYTFVETPSRFHSVALEFQAVDEDRTMFSNQDDNLTLCKLVNVFDFILSPNL